MEWVQVNCSLTRCSRVPATPRRRQWGRRQRPGPAPAGQRPVGADTGDRPRHRKPCVGEYSASGQSREAEDGRTFESIDLGGDTEREGGSLCG